MPNIHHISGVEGIVADALSRFPSATDNQDKPITTRDLSKNELFETRVQQTANEKYPLDFH